MRDDAAIESLADVQRLLLPDNPVIRGVEYAAHYQPADIAAGDYYDLMCLTHRYASMESGERDIWGMMVGDVSGHGPAAAMEAVQFDAILRTYRGDEEPGGPAGALTYANRYFFSRRARRHFMTVFSALVDPSTCAMTYVSAGHPPCLLRRGSAIEQLGNRGDIPLGVMREHRFENQMTQMHPGDVLVAYSDGLIEAVDSSGEQFGLARIEAVVANARRDASAIVDALRDALTTHQGSNIGRDDQTILAIRQVS